MKQKMFNDELLSHVTLAKSSILTKTCKLGTDGSNESVKSYSPLSTNIPKQGKQSQLVSIG